jgi:hypothetical protein
VFPLESLEGHSAIFGLDHAVACTLHVNPDNPADIRLVIGDEDARHCCTSPESADVRRGNSKREHLPKANLAAGRQPAPPGAKIEYDVGTMAGEIAIR